MGHFGAAARHSRRRGWWVALVACGALIGALALGFWTTPLPVSVHAGASRPFTLPRFFEFPSDSTGDNSAANSRGMHQYWQVGLVAGPEASDAGGMRTTVTTTLPQRVADQTTNYYWIGSYLADGSFIQIGYYVAWYSPNTAGWFYCAFSPTQQKGPCVYGPAGSAGGNGTAHVYTLEAATSSGPGQGAAQWTALVDGKVVGSFGWTSGTTGSNSPGIYAESSGFSAHAAQSTLGPVDFAVPIATRLAGQASYQPARHVRPAYAADDVCPPYGIASDGSGGALLGSHLSCPAQNQWLW